jgi:hypothetical protein
MQNPQVPVVTMPNTQPQQAQLQGPAIPAPSPTMQTTLPLQWTPVQGEGPRLLPPDKE